VVPDRDLLVAAASQAPRLRTRPLPRPFLGLIFTIDFTAVLLIVRLFFFTSVTL